MAEASIDEKLLAASQRVERSRFKRASTKC
jgi:hypothetical protein